MRVLSLYEVFKKCPQLCSWVNGDSRIWIQIGLIPEMKIFLIYQTFKFYLFWISTSFIFPLYTQLYTQKRNLHYGEKCA